MSFIKITMVGYLGKDTEKSILGSGQEVAKNSMAMSEFHGEDKPQTTTWYNLTAWGFLADKLNKCEKGSLVVIEGKPSSTAFINKSGQPQIQNTVTVSSITVLKKGGNKQEISTVSQDDGDIIESM